MQRPPNALLRLLLGPFQGDHRGGPLEEPVRPKAPDGRDVEGRHQLLSVSVGHAFQRRNRRVQDLLERRPFVGPVERLVQVHPILRKQLMDRVDGRAAARVARRRTGRCAGLRGITRPAVATRVAALSACPECLPSGSDDLRRRPRRPIKSRRAHPTPRGSTGWLNRAGLAARRRTSTWNPMSPPGQQ